jgi:SAM-dependent methyltransferase
MAGKLRQVQRFVEIIGSLLEGIHLPSEHLLRVADMGAGKGYLTFALARTLQKGGWKAQVTGVEMREELVLAGNQAARELGFESLHFEQGTIGEWRSGHPLDVLVALHACNTATDDALFQGVQAGAQLLLVSPCCHQELRPQLCVPAALVPVAQHGILLERQAEIVTDALRAHLLELKGYGARVFEFVEPEHSGKNLMLAATKRESGGLSQEMLRGEIRALWQAFGLRFQKLAQLLEEVPE